MTGSNRLISAAGILSILLLAAARDAAPGQRDPPFRLIAPANESRLPEGPVTFIILGADPRTEAALSVDGRTLDAIRMRRAPKRPGGPYDLVWVAEARLSTGLHEVRANGEALGRFRLGPPGSESPKWDLSRAHPSPAGQTFLNRCAACHQNAPGTLATVRIPTACLTCHDEADLPVRHRHVMEPLSRCASCHNLHGSTRGSLLVDTREKLCVRCHEAGHYRP